MIATTDKPTSISERLRENIERETLAALGEYDQLVITLASDPAAASDFPIERIKGLLERCHLPIEKLHADVRRMEQRQQAAELYEALPDVTAELAAVDGEIDAEQERHQLAMEKLNARRSGRASKLKEIERAEAILERYQPGYLRRAVATVRRAISFERRIIESHFGLTDEERPFVRRAGSGPTINHFFSIEPGVNSDEARPIVAAVNERLRQHDARKEQAAEHIARLESVVATLKELSLAAIPSIVEVNEILADAGFEPVAAIDICEFERSAAQAIEDAAGE